MSTNTCGRCGKPVVDEQFVEQLSGRQVEILALMVDGFTNAEIAEQLVLSLRTIEWHVDRLRAQFGEERRGGLIRRARAAGF